MRLWFSFDKDLVRIWFGFDRLRFGFELALIGPDQALSRLWFSFDLALIRLWFGFDSVLIRGFDSALIRLFGAQMGALAAI